MAHDLNDSTPPATPYTGPTATFYSNRFVLHNLPAFFKTAPDPATDTNGSVNVQYLLNFNRRPNKSGLVNPILMRITDINMTEDGTLPAFPPVTGSVTPVENNATFFYGRLHAPRYRVQGNDSIITLYYEVYCSPSGDSSGTPRTCDVRDYKTTILNNRKLSVDDIHWYVNEDHNTTFGAVNQTVGEYGINERTGVDDEITTLIPAGGTANPPYENFRMVYSGDRGYPFKATMQMSTLHHWLLYHPVNPAPATSDFELEFNTAGSWQGRSPGNINVESNASVNTSRRVEW